MSGDVLILLHNDNFSCVHLTLIGFFVRWQSSAGILSVSWEDSSKIVPIYLSILRHKIKGFESQLFLVHFTEFFFCLNLCLFSILRVEASFLFLYHDNKKGLKLSFIAVYNNRQQFFFRWFSSFWWDSVICCAVFIGHARLLEFTHCAFHFILAQTVEYSKYRPALQAMVLCAQVAEGLVCSMQPCKHAHLLCTSSFASSCI